MKCLRSLDPRTILLVFPVALTWAIIFFSTPVQDFAFTGLLFIVLLFCGRTACVMQWALLLAAVHLPFFIPESSFYHLQFLSLVVRKACMILCTGVILFSSISSHNCTHVMKKLGMPRDALIPITVCFRFVSTLKNEASIIRDALKIRGLYSCKRIALHPLATFEIFTSAFLFRAIALGEELVFSLSTKRLHFKGGQYYRDIGFSFRDACFIFLALAFMLLIMYLPVPEIAQ